MKKQKKSKKNILIGLLLFILILSTSILFIKKGLNVVEETKNEYQTKQNKENIAELEKEKELLIINETSIEEKIKKSNLNPESQEYIKLTNEQKTLSDKITLIDFEISKIKNGYYDNSSGVNFGIKKGLIFILPGVALLIISFIVLIIFIKKAI